VKKSRRDDRHNHTVKVTVTTDEHDDDALRETAAVPRHVVLVAVLREEELEQSRMID
jgi:hypothetical protein